MLNLSVIIPTYNGELFIREAIESILVQSHLPQEVVVVDDSSTDATLEVVELVSRNAPVSLRKIRLEANSGGPSRPINVGIRESSSEFVAVLDQDDIFHKSKLERHVSLLEADPSLAVVFGWCGKYENRQIHQAEKIRSDVMALGAKVGSYYRIDGRKMLRCFVEGGNCLVGYPAFTFRKKAWLDKGLIDEDLRIAGDMDLLGWLFAQGDAALVPEISYYRREHANNACRHHVEMLCECNVMRARLFESCELMRTDNQLRQKLQEHFLGTAYYFREACQYGAAQRMCALALSVGAPRGNVAAMRLKSRIHQLLHILLHRPPVHSPYSQASFGSQDVKDAQYQ